ncbi:MAG: response regulator [Desulfuromonadaceae bacterium]|nr:response regulator [Desulfuromonadaceae bacterium]
MSVLIVDDSAIAREIVKKCLTIIGFSDESIREAKNGREALMIAKSSPVRLILTDLFMPLMDGEALIRWVKASPRLHHIPVFVISSAGNDAIGQKLHKLGAEGTFCKPITPRMLQKILAPYLRAAPKNYDCPFLPPGARA